MSAQPPRRSKQKARRRNGRIQLVCAYVLLRAGDALLLWFALQPINQYPVLIGALFGGFIGSTALTAAVWLRQIWSRYVLLALLWLMVLAFSVPLMGFTESLQDFRRPPVFALLGGIGLYLCALLLLTFSNAISRLTSPGTATSEGVWDVKIRR